MLVKRPDHGESQRSLVRKHLLDPSEIADVGLEITRFEPGLFHAKADRLHRGGQIDEKTPRLERFHQIGKDGSQQVDASTALAAELLALGQDCATRLAAPWRNADHGALLYDAKGLPR